MHTITRSSKRSLHRGVGENVKALLEQRHFEVVAAIIKRLPQWNNAHDMRRAVAHHFGRELRTTNRKFKEQKFIAACGLDAYDD